MLTYLACLPRTVKVLTVRLQRKLDRLVGPMSQMAGVSFTEVVLKKGETFENPCSLEQEE